MLTYIVRIDEAPHSKEATHPSYYTTVADSPSVALDNILSQHIGKMTYESLDLNISARMFADGIYVADVDGWPADWTSLIAEVVPIVVDVDVSFR